MTRGLILLALAASAFAQPPNQSAIIESARAVAVNYSRNLPNFLCTESIERYDDYSDNGKWIPADQLTVEVTFNGKGENYRLVARNGRPTELPLSAVAGTLTTGEFGSALLLIFQLSSATEFEWQKWETPHKRRLAIFRYRVTSEHSHYTLKAGQQTAIVGYHGLVAIDPESGAVFQWSVEAEPPKGYPMMESSIHLEYDYRKIDATEYLLPVRAEMLNTERPLPEEQLQKLPIRARGAASRPMRHRNLVEFKNYRKFGVDSSVTFK
jgi:hypothetical protein